MIPAFEPRDSKMSDEIQKDLLIALKALLYVVDHRSRLTHGVVSRAEDFARAAIDRAELRDENKNMKFGGVPAGWYGDVYAGHAAEPLALLAAALETRDPTVLFDIDVEPADLDAYFGQTALADPSPAEQASVNAKP